MGDTPMIVASGTFLGPAVFLIASWTNLMLYFTEVLTSVYFFRHGRATRIYKMYVAGALTVDSIGTLTVLADAYLNLITFPMKNGFPTQQIWTLPVLIIVTYASALLEQLFLVFRCWRLTKNAWISSTLLLLVIIHFIFALTAAFYVVAHPGFKDLDLGLKFTTINVCLSAATDLLIGATLVWKLYTFETFHSGTKSLVNRIAIISLSSGLICSISTVAMLILLLTHSILFELFFACLGRIYTLTILFNFFTLKAPNLSTLHIRSRSAQVPGTQESIQFGNITSPSADQSQSRIHRIDRGTSGTGGKSPRRDSESSRELSRDNKIPPGMGIT